MYLVLYQLFQLRVILASFLAWLFAGFFASRPLFNHRLSAFKLKFWVKSKSFIVNLAGYGVELTKLLNKNGIDVCKVMRKNRI